MECQKKESVLNKWLTSLSLILAVIALGKYLLPQSANIDFEIISTQFKSIDIAIANTGNVQGLVTGVFVSYDVPSKESSGSIRVETTVEKGIHLAPGEIFKFTLESSTNLMPLYFNKEWYEESSLRKNYDDSCELTLEYLDAELDKNQLSKSFYCHVILPPS